MAAHFHIIYIIRSFSYSNDHQIVARSSKLASYLIIRQKSAAHLAYRIVPWKLVCLRRRWESESFPPDKPTYPINKRSSPPAKRSFETNELRTEEVKWATKQNPNAAKRMKLTHFVVCDFLSLCSMIPYQSRFREYINWLTCCKCRMVKSEATGAEYYIMYPAWEESVELPFLVFTEYIDRL